MRFIDEIHEEAGCELTERSTVEERARKYVWAVRMAGIAEARRQDDRIAAMARGE